jgi:hypothetical protein
MTPSAGIIASSGPRPRSVRSPAPFDSFLSWAQTIKTFTPHRLLETKIQIANIVMQQEGHDESSASLTLINTFYRHIGIHFKVIISYARNCCPLVSI